MSKSSNKKNKRETILAAAFHIYQSQGFRRATVEDIAQKAGIAKGTIYLYFQNKEEIFQALFAEMLTNLGRQSQELVTALESAPSSPSSQQHEQTLNTFFANLEKAVGNMLGYLQGTPSYFEMLSLQEPKQRAKLLAELKQNFDSLAQFYQKSLVEAQKKGLIRPEIDLGHFSRVFLAALDGLLLHFAFFIPDAPERQQKIREFLAMVRTYLEQDQSKATSMY